MKKGENRSGAVWSGICKNLRSGFLCLRVSLALALVLIVSCSLANAQQSPEARELRAALSITEQRLAQSEAQRKEVINSLAEAVRISEEQTFAAREIQEKLEAYGVDLFSNSKDSLEQRLLKAVRDLHILRQENERRRKAINDLSEAFLKYLAATPDAKESDRGEAKEAVSKAGKSLQDLVDPAQTQVKPLERSQVVSVDPELALVVLDAGRKSGVRVGTPIVIHRDDKPIYTALIVEVRESICGALLQEKAGQIDKVLVGDKVRPVPTITE